MSQDGVSAQQEKGNTTENTEAADDVKPTGDAHADELSDVEEHREHVPWVVIFLCGDLHTVVSKRPLCAMCTLCLLYLFWLLLCIILIVTEGEDFVRMVSDTPMYIRDDPIYTATDAYVQAVDESTWDAAASAGAVENRQSANFPSQLSNLVLIFEKDGLSGDDEDGLLAVSYQESIKELEDGLMELAGFEDLQQIVYNGSTEIYRVRPSTITNLFDIDYAPWAFNQTYDSDATFNNTINFIVPSKYANPGAEMNPDFDETMTNQVKSYYAGYGYLDDDGYDGYNTSYTLRYMKSDGIAYSVPNLMYYVADADFGYTPGDTAVRAAISVHFLGVPIVGYNSSTEELTAQEEELGTICYDTVHEYLWKKKSSNGFKLFWRCTGTYKDYYIGIVIQEDTFWLIATISFVFFYMVFNVNSFFIASMGLFMVFMAFTPGLVLYRYLAGYAYFGTLNMLVLFIMLSIGADNIFVLNDTWQQERNRAGVTYRIVREGNAEQIQASIRRRLQCTVGHTGKVMFTTSISTMMSFVSNSISSFPGIYCFGAFAAIVVAVNYVAVCTFMPTVLVVHELYFWTDESWPCCQREKRNPNVERKSTELTDERRPVDIFLEEKCFTAIYKCRVFILLGFFIMQSIFLVFMMQLEPDPNEPVLLPITDPVQGFNDQFSEYFTRFVDPFKITNHITIGIEGIDRAGTDATVPEDLGKAIFTEVSFTSPQEQQFLEQICSDAETGDRYGDLEDRWIDFDVQVILQCFMVQFRNSIYEDTYYENFMNEALRNDYFDGWYGRELGRGASFTRASETYFIDMDTISNGTQLRDLFSLCYEDNGPWTNRSFPILDPYQGEDRQGTCFFIVFYRWLETAMSPNDPNYSPGSTNYDHYKEYIWAESRETDDEYSGEHYINFFEFTVQLSIGMRTNYEDGLDYHDNWQAWLDNWKNGNDGEVARFQGYCYDPDTCITSEYVEMPSSWESSIMFTDTGIWPYYVLQSVILIECFEGIFYALLFAFFVIVLATGNWLISIYATLVILGLVIDVMGFTVMQGYKLSVVEAVIYIMVVGMSVDYVVHLAEAYLHSGEVLREHAARRMLGIVGMAVISGAISTCGGIMFLIFSYNMFFKKFGINIFFLMIMASLYALVGFTAAMSSFGPQGSQGNTTVCYYWWRSLCNEEFKSKLERLRSELDGNQPTDALETLPKSKHSKLVMKRQATLKGNNDSLGAGQKDDDL